MKPEQRAEYDHGRNKRPYEVRAKTVRLHVLKKERRNTDEQAADTQPGAMLRPRMRGDCIDGPRPCPWVGCRYHLYLDVTPGGGIKFNRPDVAPDELEKMTATCALDVADRGEQTYYALPGLMNMTRPGAYKLALAALDKLKQSGEKLREAWDYLETVLERDEAEIPDDGDL